MNEEQKQVTPTKVTPETISTPSLVEQLQGDSLDATQAAQPYAQSAEFMKQLNTNALNSIKQDHIDTIGTERGGQRSLLVGGNDNYMMSRYSTPAVEDLANTFKVAAQTKAFNQSISNELEKMQKEYEKAAKARKSRDSARAAVAAASSSSDTATKFGEIKEKILDDPNAEKWNDGSGNTPLSVEEMNKRALEKRKADARNEAIKQAEKDKSSWIPGVAIVNGGAGHIGGFLAGLGNNQDAKDFYEAYNWGGVNNYYSADYLKRTNGGGW